MSTDLHWLLTRNWTSYQVRQGNGTPTFSREPDNLLNISSPKYSGALGHAIGVRETKDKGFTYHHRKADALVHHVAKGRETKTLDKQHGLHRSAKHATSVAHDGQRPELSRATAARVHALMAARRAKKSKSKSAKKSEA
ncbi:hypothetical protein FRB94_001694 [Tulasnella sp. JGI-2019a]|nr:hypothetical protein FRB93_007183 [Tulasnella sp. JGI-2019a]KAG9013589.1 hypothetical protein FRB94_001694 [Tulasnella sp. JGI-2019a]